MNAILQITIYCLLIIAATKPAGVYIHWVFEGKKTPLDRVFRPIERGFYRIAGIDENAETRWTTYTVALLLFSMAGALFTYLIMRLQHGLPLNPANLANVEPRLAFNKAISFTTNTNWQSYVPEVTMSYLSNMFALAGAVRHVASRRIRGLGHPRRDQCPGAVSAF
jgi:K+-transporting ATPase ATPase A chain